MTSLEIGHEALSLEDIRSVALAGREVALSKKALGKIKKSHEFLASELRKGKTIYGVNTGFGLLSNVKISSSQIEQLQLNLLRSHAVGVGPSMPDHYVRAMLLLRAHTLALGF